jgi:hypothetical protein
VQCMRSVGDEAARVGPFRSGVVTAGGQKPQWMISDGVPRRPVEPNSPINTQDHKGVHVRVFHVDLKAEKLRDLPAHHART